LSRRDYIAIAEVIRATTLTSAQRSELALRLSAVFKMDNPRFDQDRFVLAATKVSG
jgi:hypothetical protein